MNRAIVMGRLGRDPETLTMKNGDRLVRFSLATNEHWTTGSGEKQQRVDWHRCEAWKGVGDVIAKHCRKGDRILVEGRIRVDTVEGQDGGRKTFNKILVDRFEFTEGKRDGGPADDLGDHGGDDLSDVPF